MRGRNIFMLFFLVCFSNFKTSNTMKSRSHGDLPSIVGDEDDKWVIRITTSRESLERITISLNRKEINEETAKEKLILLSYKITAEKSELMKELGESISKVGTSAVNIRRLSIEEDLIKSKVLRQYIELDILITNKFGEIDRSST